MPKMSKIPSKYVSLSIRQCQYCDYSASSKGIASHERACKRKREDAKRTKEIEESLRLGKLAAETSRYSITAAQASAFSSLITNNDTTVAVPMDVDAVKPNDAHNNADELFNDSMSSHTLSASNDATAPTPPSPDNASGSSATTSTAPARVPPPIDPITKEPIPDPIKVVYHPKSGREEEVISHHEYRNRSYHSDSGLVDREPWAPFSTRADYEYAEIALAASLSAAQNAALISLIQRIATGEALFTLTSNNNLQDCWQSASAKLTPFEKETFEVPYMKEERSFVVYYRPIWDWAMDLLSDARIVSRFYWDSRKMYRYDPRTENYIRFFDEPWTGDRFWDIQSNHGNAKPFGIIFYADKNKLSSFGTEKGYPVIARCANLPVEMRNGEGLGGGVVVGWLPIVRLFLPTVFVFELELPNKGSRARHAGDSGKVSFANFKSQVWHNAMKIIFNSIRSRSKTGCHVKCADGIQRHLYPSIMIMSADFEEQSVIALTHGAKGNKPCPICFITKDSLSNLSLQPKLRTAEKCHLYFDLANLLRTAEARENCFKKYGLRPIANSFWDIANSDPHRSLSWDRLHGYHSGLFAAHLWPAFKEVINELGREAAANIDNRFASFPAWRDLCHFDNVMKITFNDGKKHEDVSKQLLFAAHNTFEYNDESEGYLLLCLLRSFLVLDVYFSFDLHTSETVAAGRIELQRFGEILKKYITLTAATRDKKWNFPKAHLQFHAFDDIVAKGATRNFNTKPNEKMHGPLRDFYQATNFKNVAPQILKLSHYTLIATFIRGQMDVIDAEKKKIEKEIALENEGRSEQSRNGPKTTDIKTTSGKKIPPLPPNDKYYLGAPEDIYMLSYLEEQQKSDVAFKDFRKKLTKFLNDSLPAYGVQLRDNRHMRLAAGHEIIEYRFLKVKFESLVTWQVETDYLRCNPSFFRKSRYDYIMVDTISGVIFAQLLHVFAITIDSKSYELALIQAFDAYTV